MPVKYVKRFDFNMKKVDAISSAGDISVPLAKLLVGRGVETYDDAQKFLNPSADDLSNPFLLYGMKEAADRVQRAIDNDERVLIYGDYDCDGLSAISILFCYLRDKLENLDYYVPKRHAEGYGLHNIVIEDLTENNEYDLIITVDCGITSRPEVEYIKSKGIDVVITDHHEPIEGLIPNCIVLNPKVDKKGFYDYCGAGVVFKLVEAIAGREKALEYVGIAAVGTIADIVPLVGENRIIAKLGLDKINKFETPAARIMAGQLNRDKINANDVMFRVAPRINALGRLKDATPVVSFFTSENEKEINNIVLELEENNKERQALCESVVRDITEKLKKYDLKNNRIIVMADKEWNVGILGIAASKLAETFYRPVILFTEGEDGILRGSARSNNKVNIFECLNACKEYFVAFGGHQAAAGVSIKPENLDAFRVAINKYIVKNYDITQFYPDVVYDLRYSKDIDYKCVQQFEKLEPCGFGNPTPVFYLENANLKFVQIGTTAHIKSYYNGLELVAFNYMHNIEAVNSETSFVFTLQNKVYKQKRYTQGIIKLHTMFTPKNINEEFVALRYLMYNLLMPHKSLTRPVKRCKAEDINLNDGIFGNLYIAFCSDTFYKFIDRIKTEKSYAIRNITTSVTINPFNRIILTPRVGFDYGYYKNIYILDEPISDDFVANLQASTDANIYIVGEKREKANLELIRKLRCKSENEYREIYKYLKANKVFNSKNIYEVQGKLYELQNEISPFKIMTTLYIMFELGLIEQTEKDGFEFLKGVKNTLHNSIIYKYIENF